MFTEAKEKMGYNYGNCERSKTYEDFHVHVVQVNVHPNNESSGTASPEKAEESKIADEENSLPPILPRASKSKYSSSKELRLWVEGHKANFSVPSSANCPEGSECSNPSSPTSSSSSGCSSMSAVSTVSNCTTSPSSVDEGFKELESVEVLEDLKAVEDMEAVETLEDLEATEVVEAIEDVKDVEGDKEHIMRKLCESLEVAHDKHWALFRRLAEPQIIPTVEEWKKLQMLQDSTKKIQRKISDLAAAAALNIKRQREEEIQELEDFYYKKYGFVFLEADALEEAFEDRSSFNEGTCSQLHGPEAIEKNLEKLKRRLNNLGKSPEVQKELAKDTAIYKKKQSKKNCIIT